MSESSNTYTEHVDLLSIGDVARALGVTVATVRRWDAAGRIESIRTPGGQRRFPSSEVARLRAS